MHHLFFHLFYLLRQLGLLVGDIGAFLDGVDHAEVEFDLRFGARGAHGDLAAVGSEELEHVGCGQVDDAVGVVGEVVGFGDGIVLHHHDGLSAQRFWRVAAEVGHQVLIANSVFTEYKGGMTEQYVLQQMKSFGIEPIYYHKTEDSRLEIDFVIQQDAQLLPIEVKAEGNVRANSLTNFLKENPEIHAVRYSMLPYKEQSQMTNIPLYLYNKQ